ncbi:hypothetical protein [Lysobacter antibioticus]|uniref:Putative nucleoside-diphosphate-sugar epimerase n=1 Tax=Lysobacter antibioticus TaxID=84531 RepID=A0A0S2FCW5_LYSAN|nr:hypothetical protein [Lysobacter antibioticus]ALN81293.1 putative nucleoside-diphosphate-sugar epimerase [Lysobacter antibioticus]
MLGRTIIAAGATGLVGREILAGLLADASVAAVHSLSRRRPAEQHPRLTAHGVDFAALLDQPRADEVYLALTIKMAGSQAAFRAVDYGANLAVATAALAAGAKRSGLVSPLGADSNTRQGSGIPGPAELRTHYVSAVASALPSAISSAKGRKVVLSRAMPFEVLPRS